MALKGHSPVFATCFALALVWCAVGSMARGGALPAAPVAVSVSSSQDHGASTSETLGTDLPPSTVDAIGAADVTRCRVTAREQPVRYQYPVPPPSALPAPCAPFEDCNGKLLHGDPFVDRLDYPEPGWFAAIDLSLVVPHVKNRLTDVLTLPGPGGPVTDTVHLGSAALDWVGSPSFTFGYRPGQAVGEFLVTYRSLVSDGAAVLPGFDVGPGFLKSRLSLYTWDLDYGAWESSLAPQVDMKWHVGVRLADVFFDSRAAGFFREERTSNFLCGAGPHAGLDLWGRCFGWAGIVPFAKIDSSLVIGRIEQSFEETTGVGSLRLAGAADRQGKNQAVPVVRAQAGLGFTPPGAEERMRFALGYDYEQWWYIGRVNESRGEITGQGILFRAEFNY